jgi:DNA-binding transcriptional LysR family regulator
MPDRLDSMAAFVAVANHGSFAAAGKVLRISPQMVAKHIGALEAHLKVRLINRTTRQQSLTEFGRQYCDNCRGILADVASAEARALDVRRNPRGQLRINAPVMFGTNVLMPLLTSYLERYPDVNVDLVLTDRLVDPIEEDFEAVFRVGPVDETTRLISRPLMSYRLILCASPVYLAKHGVPKTPEDLRKHQCLQYNYSAGDQGVWRLRKGNKTYDVAVRERLKANDWNGLHRASHLAFGIALGPEIALRDNIDAGSLVHIMPEFEGPVRPVHLIYACDRQMTPKLRCFVEMVTDALSNHAANAAQ